MMNYNVQQTFRFEKKSRIILKDESRKSAYEFSCLDRR